MMSRLTSTLLEKGGKGAAQYRPKDKIFGSASMSQDASIDFEKQVPGLNAG
jgi:hypothetical protein